MESSKERRFRVIFQITKVAETDTHEAILLLGVQDYFVP
jgi:hypothetical protein